MKHEKLTSAEFLDQVRPMFTRIDDDLYAHEFGHRQVQASIEQLVCESEVVEHWVESLAFRLEQARLAACDAWNLSLCDLLEDLERKIQETSEAEQRPAKPSRNDRKATRASGS